MKKLIAIALVTVMAMSLCACGNDNPYPEYDYIDEMLAAGDYQGAVNAIYELYQQNNGGENNGGENNNGENNGNSEQNQQTEPPRPTDEEWTVLRQYRELYNKLLYYVEENSVYIYDEEDNYYEGSAALGYILTQLQAIDTAVIDKWVGTEYTGTNYLSDRNGNEIDWNYNSLIAGFSKLDNVLLRQLRSYLDNMENVSTSSNVEYYYNSDGSVKRIYNQDYAFELIESNPWNLSGTQEYTYDDAGRIIKIKYMDGTNVRSIVDLTYDANGNVINEHIKQNSGEIDITYEYDEHNRLVKIEHPYSIGSSTIVTYTYTYDANGNMVKEEKVQHSYQERFDADIVNYKYIREFTYDANGSITSGFYKYEYWSYDTDYLGDGKYNAIPYIYREKLDQYAITTDSQGRLSTVVITYGDEVYVHGNDAGKVYDTPDYVSRTYEFVYGDYYFYNPVK